MAKDGVSVWKDCLDFIRGQVEEQHFRTWFEPITLVSLDGNTLTIQVPSQFFYEYLEEHYVHILRQVILKILGPEGKLEYSVIVDSGSRQNQPYVVTLPNQRDKKAGISMPEVRNPFDLPSLQDDIRNST